MGDNETAADEQMLSDDAVKAFTEVVKGLAGGAGGDEVPWVPGPGLSQPHPGETLSKMISRLRRARNLTLAQIANSVRATPARRAEAERANALLAKAMGPLPVDRTPDSLLGIGTRWAANVETGLTIPGSAEVARIAQALGADPDAMVGLREEAISAMHARVGKVLNWIKSTIEALQKESLPFTHFATMFAQLFSAYAHLSAIADEAAIRDESLGADTMAWLFSFEWIIAMPGSDWRNAISAAAIRSMQSPRPEWVGRLMIAKSAYAAGEGRLCCNPSLPDGGGLTNE